MAKTHTLSRGETIVEIALQNGFRTWETIWEHAGNADLRKLRPNPHILAQGDKLFIPDKEVEYRDCQTNQKHVFRVKAIREYLQQTLLNENGAPLANLDYELTAGDKTYRRKTSAAGVLREEISVEAQTANSIFGAEAATTAPSWNGHSNSDTWNRPRRRMARRRA